MGKQSVLWSQRPNSWYFTFNKVEATFFLIFSCWFGFVFALRITQDLFLHRMLQFLACVCLDFVSFPSQPSVVLLDVQRRVPGVGKVFLAASPVVPFE